MSRKVLLTGGPGCGKSTVVRRTVDRLEAGAGGFGTEEIRQGRRRVGFRVEDIYTGCRTVLAHADYTAGPRVSTYRVDVATFKEVGVAAVYEALGREGWIVIDEVGKMELFSEGFPKAVTAALNAPLPLLATLARHRHPFIDAIRNCRHVQVIRITPKNRKGLPERLG